MALLLPSESSMVQSSIRVILECFMDSVCLITQVSGPRRFSVFRLRLAVDCEFLGCGLFVLEVILSDTRACIYSSAMCKTNLEHCENLRHNDSVSCCAL